MLTESSRWDRGGRGRISQVRGSRVELNGAQRALRARTPAPLRPPALCPASSSAEFFEFTACGLSWHCHTRSHATAAVMYEPCVPVRLVLTDQNGSTRNHCGTGT